MLNTPARNATAIAQPVSMSGMARTSVAEVSAYQDPTDPVHNASSAAATSYLPSMSSSTMAARMPPTAPSATITERMACERATMSGAQHRSSDGVPAERHFAHPSVMENHHAARQREHF